MTRLRKFIDEKVITSNFEFYCTVYNLGISGDTTENILESFEFETKQRLSEEETIIIFSVAINDATINNETKTLKVLPEKYQENIKTLINLARKYSAKIIFVSSLPVDENKVDPIPWLPNSSYKNEYEKQYDEITKKVCEEEKIGFVEIFQKVINSNYQKLLEDGVHGNSLGHEFIFQEVKGYLIKNKIIDSLWFMK